MHLHLWVGIGLTFLIGFLGAWLAVFTLHLYTDHQLVDAIRADIQMQQQRTHQSPPLVQPFPKPVE